MDLIKLNNTVNSLSKVVPVSEEKKRELITRFSTMSESDVIKELSQIAYSVLKDDEMLYNSALSVIRNINPEICPSIDEMKVIINKMYSNEIDGNMSLEDNHKLVNESLVTFTTLFNQYGIDYYIVGALPCFLKTGQPLFRYHDDIDIMVNEADMAKVAEVIASCGYIFQDDRFPGIERFREMSQNKPSHTVLAQNPNNEFHLGFFTFRREEDNSITMREYSHREAGAIVEVDVLERRSDPVGTMLRYDDVPVEYMGTSFRTSSVESVYSLKAYTRRPKDITDIEKLKPFIDEKKLEELKQHPNFNFEFRNIPYDDTTSHTL